MSAVNATIQALLADAAVASVVGTQVSPVMAPESATTAHIVVNLVFEQEVDALASRSKFAEARVSVECRAPTATAANSLGEKVKDALLKDHAATYAGCIVRFVKEGTDFTDYEEQASVKRRVLDFYVWWRRAA